MAARLARRRRRWWFLGLVVLAVYLPLRWRFVREATAGRRFLEGTSDPATHLERRLDLFALRALSRHPLHRLARVSDDPAGAWRRGDPDVVHALASLELRSTGLRVPDRSQGPAQGPSSGSPESPDRHAPTGFA